MDKRYEKLLKCRDYVRSVTDFVPKAALVLGSGLGGFAEALDVVCEVPYSDIPGLSRLHGAGPRWQVHLRLSRRRACCVHAGPHTLLRGLRALRRRAARRG